MKKIVLLAMFMAVVLLVSGCGQDTEAHFQDGTYTSSAQGHSGPVDVQVIVEGGKIATVDVTDHSETAGIADAAIATIPAEVVAKQSADVDTVSGATQSSKAIIEAVSAALAEAAI